MLESDLTEQTQCSFFGYSPVCLLSRYVAVEGNRVVALSLRLRCYQKTISMHTRKVPDIYTKSARFLLSFDVYYSRNYL
jgi:hypothetical protein